MSNEAVCALRRVCFWIRETALLIRHRQRKPDETGNVVERVSGSYYLAAA
jgi:hypothetical protein